MTPQKSSTLRSFGLLVLLILFQGSNLSSVVKAGGTPPTPQGSSAIRDLVTSTQLSDLRWPNFTDYKAHVAEFYEFNGYTPAWLQGRQPSPQAMALIDTFKNAWKKGLQPEDYDAPRWDERIHALQSSDADPSRFDVALTVCTMRLVSDLRIGRINPKHLRFGLSVEQKKYDLARFLRERLLPSTDLAG